MKSISSIIMIMIFISLTGFMKDPLASGNTHCCLGKYFIEKASDPMVIDGNVLPCFVVSYENSDMRVLIGVNKIDKKCTSYIVHSDELTVQYDCNKKYFGVNKLDRRYEKSGLDASDHSLNKSEYFHQKVLSRMKRSDLESIKLISVYFPKLIDNYEIIFAVK